MPQEVVNIKEKKLPKGVEYNGKTLKISGQIIEPVVFALSNNEPLVIEAQDSSEAKIIIEINNNLKESLKYDVDLILKPNSNITYLLVTELLSDDATINQNVIIEKDASLNFMVGFLNNRLIGIGSNVNVRVVTISGRDNSQTVDVIINHEAKNSKGLMYNVAIASANGRIVLNGIEKILKGNSKSDAYQNLQGITTSNDAFIEVNPILLIDEYDVTAGHGATVGQLDEESIYYLMSRGLTKKEAEKLMINGLIRPVVDEITDKDIKERFINVVNKRL
jgi:Fe-S cluster assembly protein SufD